MVKFNQISFTISNYSRNHQSSHSPFLSRLFSSSYNNRFNDGDRPPSPRRRSGDSGFTPTNRTPSRLSGFIDDDRSENRGRGRRDFDGIRPSIHRSEYRKPLGNNNSNNSNNSSVWLFDDNDDDDNEQKPRFSPNRKVIENKSRDVDGFLDKFKLGFDREQTKSNADKLEEDVVEKVSPPEDADEIFRKMKETGLIPNAVAMLHGLCSDGLVNEAMKLFGVMRERGSIPEVVIYTAVVEGFCKSGKCDEAVRIFRKMQSNGIVPNAFSYGVLVQGLVKGKRLDDGFDFCLEMVEAGHSPNLATFTGLVNLFCRERGLEAAQVMISKLKENGFGFDEKSVRDFMEKKGPFLPLVWEAIFGKKSSEMF